MPSKDELKRLAFIKYLYQTAVEQSRRPEPMRCASILTFHDSVELFLGLIAEHFSIRVKGMGFMDYWDPISEKLEGDELSHREGMRRFNQSRVSLKHHGNSPSTDNIESFRDTVTSFFEENTPRVLGVEFETISLIYLVQCEDGRRSLEEASRAIEEGRREEALEHISIAYHRIIGDFRQRTETALGHSLFFHERFRQAHGYDSIGRLNDTLEELIDDIESVQEAVNVIGLGLDYRRYVEFRSVTPRVYATVDGKELTYPVIYDEVETPSAEDCGRCLDFVVDAAIRLQS